MPPAPSPSDEVSPAARSAYDAALQDREERLALALAAARLGTWEWRAADDVSTWSPRCCAIFGLDHFSGTLADFTAMIHPDDRERTDVGFAKAARDSGTATVEHRIVRPDGSVRWVSTLCHCRFGPDGRLAGTMGTVEDITERREAEEQLRVREERLALALAFTGTGIWEWDIGTDQVYWSPEVRALIGAEDPAPTLESFRKVVHPDDWPAIQARIDEALASRREFRARFRVRLPDGGLRWLEDIGRASYDDAGRPVRMIGTVRDVTAEQEAVSALERSEQRFRELAEALPAIVWTADPAGHFDFVSPQWTAYSGEEPALGTGGGWLAHVHPDDLAAMVAVIERAVATHQDVHHEVRLKGRSGTYRWFEIRATMRRDAAGQPLKWNGTVVDVDDAHRTREALAARDEQLTELGATAPGVMFTFRMDPAGRFTLPFTSAGVETIFGIRAEQLAQDAAPIFSMTHPEDLAGLLGSIQQSAQTLAPWHREWRIRHPERGELWVEAQSRPIPDAGGGIRWHGFVTVVTERKRLEQWASSTLKELRDLREALDHHAIVAITDAKGTITYVNENFCRISQYRRDELIGQNHRILKSGVHPPAFYTGIWRAISAGSIWQGDICNRARDGSLYWVATTIVPFLDDAGVPVQYIAIRTDITAQRESAAEIRRWADAFEHCAHGIAMHDPVTNRLIACNTALARLHGGAVAEMVGRPIADLYPAAERPRVVTYLEESDRVGHVRYESIYQRADGGLVPVQVDLVTVRGEHGRPLYRIATVEDIGDRRRAEAALREATDQLRAVVAASPIPIIVTDLDTRVLLWSRAASALFGYTEAEVLGQPMPIVPPDLQEGHATIRAKVRQGEHLGSYLSRRQARDGRLVEVSISTAPLHDHDGRVVGIVATYLDLTEGQELRAALRISEARFGQVFELSPVGMMLIRARDREVVEANEAYLRLARATRAQVVGHSLDAVGLAASPADRERLWQRAGQVGRLTSVELPIQRKDGTTGHALLSAERVTLQGEAFWLTAMQDVTQRRAAEAALRESEERFRQLAEGVREVFWMTDAATDEVVYVSPACEAVWGLTPGALLATPERWLQAVHPDDRARVGEAARTRQRTGAYDEEYRVVRPDGAIRWVRDRAFPVHDEHGAVIRIAGVAEDVTERRHLEAQLRQTQKMESIGQLAGGVAHDFNNWLTVIGGCTELLLTTFPTEGDTAELLNEIRHASERAASLTRQLLAFSRREVVEAKVCDLNTIILDTEKMLRRLLGEDVELTTTLAAGLPPVKVDPGQWSQVLMNLAVNARDAMPTGGRLQITTAIDEPDPGMTPVPGLAHPMRLSLSDTGTGMTPEVRARIFEPFFTTKGVGKGTGLGLAVVHGIVTQAGGHIEVESEPGRGTTFHIYLPPALGALGGTAGRSGALNVRGSETILLVEDEDSLRRIAAPALRAQGYTVLQASNGEEALEVLGRHSGLIHLLLTDVVMPRMDGHALAEALRPRYPEMKVLYTSGYTDDAVVRHGIQHNEVAFLSKPYTPLALLRKIRQVLARA